MVTVKRKKNSPVKTRTEVRVEGESDTSSFRLRSAPGPRGLDAELEVEQELSDAATIVELVSQKRIKVNRLSSAAPRSRVEKRAPRLSQEQEGKLALRVQQYGDLDARNALVVANIGLVHLVVSQFDIRKFRYDDLVQEGIMGLIRATETFEPAREIRFSTYSVYWIRAKIQRLLQKIGRDDNPAITGAEAIVNEEGRKEKPRSNKISLDRTSSDGDDIRTLNDILPSATPNPEHCILATEREHAIRQVLMEIAEDLHDPRVKILVDHRVLAEDPVTLNELGTEIGLSREGVRLMESRLLRAAKTKLARWKDSGSN